MTLPHTLPEETLHIEDADSFDSARTPLRFRFTSVDASSPHQRNLPEVQEAEAIIRRIPVSTLRDCAASLIRSVLLAIRAGSVRGLEDTISYWYQMANQTTPSNQLQRTWDERIEELADTYERESVELTVDLDELYDEDFLAEF